MRETPIELLAIGLIVLAAWANAARALARADAPIKQPIEQGRCPAPMATQGGTRG
jgi:hypothetical protein